MEIKRIMPEDPDAVKVEQLNKEAFPAEESMSLNDMFAFPGDSAVLGFYDKNAFIGFSLLTKNASCVYMILFAINTDLRGKGYGSTMLRMLVEYFRGLQVILDFEEILSGAPNYEQRLRRKNFYLRNGFYETGQYTVLAWERYEIVCTQLPLDKTGLLDIIKLIHQFNPMLDDRIY